MNAGFDMIRFSCHGKLQDKLPQSCACLSSATMLGKLEIVKAAVVAFPNIVHVPGPHGIPLIVHAEKGGLAAKDVLEFLRPLVGQRISVR